MSDPPRISADDDLRHVVTALQSQTLDASRVLAIRSKLEGELRPPKAPVRRWPLLLAAALLLLAAAAGAALLRARSIQPPSAPSLAPPSTQVASPQAPINAGAPEVVAAPSAVSTAKPAFVPPPRSAATSPDPFLEEDRLVRAARAKLATDPAGALALTDEHARKFPGGTLSQEREVIAIEALSKLGRRTEASRRGTAFIAAYPTSAHRAHVEQLLAAP